MLFEKCNAESFSKWNHTFLVGHCYSVQKIAEEQPKKKTRELVQPINTQPVSGLVSYRLEVTAPPVAVLSMH